MELIIWELGINYWKNIINFLIIRNAEYPFAGNALKVLEPYAVKIARTVLRGRKLPGCVSFNVSRMNSLLDKEIIKEDDIRKLISSKAEESIHLDFKQAKSLGSSDKRKTEIAKDVSSFANSAGGMIVYGISEVNHVADSLSFIDGDVYAKEWIEQIIQSNGMDELEMGLKEVFKTDT